MTRHIVFLGVIAMFVPSLSLASDQLDSIVYRCQGPSGTDLYTNKKQPGCEVMNLPELTIAPIESPPCDQTTQRSTTYASFHLTGSIMLGQSVP